MTTTTGSPKPGDWVQVWGQVVNQPCHPEDVVVEFFSHSSNYAADILRERVTVQNFSPFATKCKALHGAGGYHVEEGVYMKCLLTAGHADMHEDYDGEHWDDHGGTYLDE